MIVCEWDKCKQVLGGIFFLPCPLFLLPFRRDPPHGNDEQRAPSFSSPFPFICRVLRSSFECKRHNNTAISLWTVAPPRGYREKTFYGEVGKNEEASLLLFYPMPLKFKFFSGYPYPSPTPKSRTDRGAIIDVGMAQETPSGLTSLSLLSPSRLFSCVFVASRDGDEKRGGGGFFASAVSSVITLSLRSQQYGRSKIHPPLPPPPPPFVVPAAI